MVLESIPLQLVRKNTVEPRTLPPLFSVDYSTPTVPFPKDFYLRRSMLEQAETIIQRGDSCEFTGGDGDGKSTMVAEAARYLKDKGYPVLPMDIRIQVGIGSAQDQIEEFLKRYGTSVKRPVLCLDNADHLWQKHDKKWTYEALLAERARLKALGSGLSRDNTRLLIKFYDQLELIEYLQKIRSRAGIVLTAHSPNTSVVKDYRDEGLRREFLKLNPVVLSLSEPYSREEAIQLLNHFGLTDQRLIGIILEKYLSHEDLKLIACARWGGKTIQERFQEQDFVANASSIERWKKYFPGWVEQIKQSVKG